MPRALLSLLLLPSLTFAQPRPDETLAPDLDARIARGLAYLARQQRPDGSFQNRDPGSDEKNPRFSGQKVPLTALSLLAFASAGRMPDTGKHGLAVRSAIDYLVKNCPDDGYFGKIDDCKMTGHAMATLALAEIHGTESDPARRKGVGAALDRAVKVLLAAQAVPKPDPFAGGWNNDRSSPDSDLLVTAWCALALRAALDAGVDVPKDSADRAAAFVLKCYRPDKTAFAPQPAGGEVTIPATAAGLLALQLLDRATRPESAAAKYLVEHAVASDPEYPYLTRYFTVLAAHELGGPAWPTLWDRTQAKLLGYQKEDGSFPQKTAKEPGQTYATAISVMTLSIPLRLLPAYQR